MKLNRWRIFEEPWLLLALILFLALTLRLWGIEFGLPYRYHPDEPQHVVEAARMLAERRLEPVIFNNPPFYKYVLALGDAVFFIGALLFGEYNSTTDLVEHLSVDPAPLYLLGRVISAVAGSLTVWVIYLSGKSAYNRRVGLIAAMFLAVAFLHVRDSHYAVNDALLVLLTTTTLLGAILIAQRGQKRDYILGAVAAGLAFATKYTGIFVVIPLVLAHFLSPGIRFSNGVKLKLKWLVGAGILVGISAILGSPYFILKPQKVLSDISMSIYSYGQYGFEGWQIDSVGGYVFYLKSLWWGLGPGLFLLVLSGIVLALWRHSKEDLLILSFPLILYLFMGRQQMYFARFILPAVPPLLLLGASVVNGLTGYAVSKFRTPGDIISPQSIVVLLIAVMASLPSVTASMRHNYLLTQTDTRTLAKEWIEANIPEGTKIAVDWPHHGPPLSTITNPEPVSSRTYDMLTIGGNGLSDYPLEYYREDSVQYIVTSSNIYNIPVGDLERNDERDTFYASLDQELILVQEISPYRKENDVHPFIFDEIYGPAISLWQRERPGPTIKIYQCQFEQVAR